MHWGWYLGSPHNPSTSVFLSQICSSAVSTQMSHSICAMGGDTVISRGCCHHTSSIATHCSKACCGVKYGAHTSLFVLLLSFIRIWRNHNIKLKKKNTKFLHTPLLMTVSVYVHPAELPGMDTHLNHIPLPCHHEIRCMLTPSSPQPHAQWCASKASCYFRNFQPVNKVFGVKSSKNWDRRWQLRAPWISMHKW